MFSKRETMKIRINNGNENWENQKMKKWINMMKNQIPDPMFSKGKTCVFLEEIKWKIPKIKEMKNGKLKKKTKNGKGGKKQISDSMLSRGKTYVFSGER